MLPWLAVLGVCCLAVICAAALALQPWTIRVLHSLLAVRNRELSRGTTADVALILGYALTRNGRPMQPLKDRMAAGVHAVQQGQCQHAILSGRDPGDGIRLVTEAQAMARYASQLMGVDEVQVGPPRWLLEEASTSTRENAMFSLPMVQAKGWHTVVLVTSEFHQLRSLLTVQRALQDLKLQPPPDIFIAAVPLTPREGLSGAALDAYDWGREIAALAWYWYKGYI